jgi:hypothetical protein
VEMDERKCFRDASGDTGVKNGQKEPKKKE